MAFYLALHNSVSAATDYSAMVVDYTPTAGPPEAERVTENLRLRIKGTNVAAVRAILDQLGAYFQQAQDSDEKKIPLPVYIRYSPEGDSTYYYRSRLLSGAFTGSTGNLEKAQVNNNVFILDFTWQRENFWTYYTGTDAVSYNNTTNAYTGVGYNHNTTGDAWRVYNSYAYTAVDDEVYDAAHPPNGVLTTFTHTTANANLLHRAATPLFAYTIGATAYSKSYDQILADMATNKVSALSVNFLTGVCSITFTDPPDNGSAITIDYAYGYDNALYSGASWMTPSGDAPEPLHIDFESKIAAGDKLYEVFIGAFINWNRLASDEYPTMFFEGEDATAILAGSSNDATDTKDSGSTVIFWENVDVTTEQNLCRWEIGDIELWGGRYFAPIIHFSETDNTDLTDLRFRWKIYTDSGGALGNLLWSGEQFQPTTADRLFQTGVIQMPPWDMTQYYQTTVDPYETLSLWVVLTAQADAITKDIAVDYVMFMPTDYFTRLTYFGYSAAENEHLHIDTLLKTSWSASSTNESPIANWLTFHGWPYLQTGADCAYYVLFQDLVTHHAYAYWALEATAKYYKTRRVI